MRNENWRNREMKAKVLAAVLMGAAVFFVWTILKMNAVGEEQQKAYEALPVAEKAKVELLMGEVLAAKRGDFLETADGRVSLILRAENRRTSVLVWVRRSSGETEYPLVFLRSSIRREVAAVVSRDNPRAGELALKFLEQ
ncbi:MAG: hypothetical protein LiPW15_718 [Parcubacteria group bacterium LiPW_15]|nr:MAG: hypothetical protein LiPW15_718 [Parcubacteria group bacterium LiPW_15]